MAAAAPPGGPRVMVLPFPAQGHVMPFMELAHRLVEHGIEVDFVNTDFNHDRVVKAGMAVPAGIHMVSLPDGMRPDGDRTDIGKLAGGLPAAMRVRVEEMVVSRKLRWVVVDISMSWALELVATAGVRVALFSPFSAAAFALRMNFPKMIEDGFFDEWGNATSKERIQLSPRTPAVDATELPLISLGKNPESRRILIQSVIKAIPAIQLAEIIVCNTFEEIESEALALFPKPALAIGPLEVQTSSTADAACNFWPEDRTCLAWLDAQAPGSVVYVAFGSLAVFDVVRLQELAEGLVLTGRPFLWVFRPNFADGVGEGWLDELKRRVSGAGGLVVGWAPQQRVLSHPSVACFVTHCGWNSTMEGVRHGVPFLCWPYFADQFFNQRYVCDVWGTGLRICAGEGGVVTKEEIRDKVARLLGDEGIKARVLSLKKAACASVADGGSSHRDLLKFVNLLREYRPAKYVPPIRPVGRGAFGIICAAVNAQTREEVTIKKIGNAFDNQIDAKRTLREVKLLRHMNHENLLGSPDDTSLGFLRSDNARRYVRSLPQYPKQQFRSRFPNMSSGAMDLLERMLVFDPNKRITVDEALCHPYLAALHEINDEPVCPAPFSFDFEQPSFTEEDIKELIWRESLKFNPEPIH